MAVMHAITTTATWTTSNSAVATVGSQGLVTGGMTAGNATITATLNGTLGTTSVTVQASPAPPAVSSVSPTAGPAGTSVTISGSGFGSMQGSGIVWLGTHQGNVTNWSDTQITATVNSGSQSGNAQVLQNGLASNAIAFTVSTAYITTVSPNVGVPGTVVTIDGSGFGTSQGQVWLGTVLAVVDSWTDTQVVAEVAIGSVSGNTQVLQNGVMSNKVPFTVDTLQITAINPSSGAAGTSVIITGTGFGSTQGTGSVVLGTTTWQVTSWTDTQITATVASGSVTGVVHVLQNGQWSNAMTFKVPGGSVTLVPNMINMVVGDTHTIEALNSSGQSVTGLTWTSSNTNVVSLSTDDPPVLTAVAAGHATITAGAASADITVSPSRPWPIGTVLWSNPGDGSGVAQIIPAVPSATGVADVFAIENDGRVAAIASDGTTAWTADVSNAMGNGWIIADFQGGLLIFDAGAQTVTKLDGITGQPYPAFTPSSGTFLDAGIYNQAIVAHPDGTVFAVDEQGDGSTSIAGFDPVTGIQKFSVPLPHSASPAQGVGGGIYQNSFADPNNSLIIAGDGYAYLAYAYGDALPYPSPAAWHLGVFRVNSAGQSDDIRIQDWSIPTYLWPTFNVSMISNADTGVVVSWAQGTLGAPEARPGHLTAKDSSDISSYGLAITNGTSVTTTVNTGLPPNGFLIPGLQLQDGSFAGTLEEGTGGISNGQIAMVGFDANGNIRWTVPNDQPQIATESGLIIGQSGVAYDATGNATSVTTQPTQSWTGSDYMSGASISSIGIPPAEFAPDSGGFWSQAGGNPSGNGTAFVQCACLLQSAGSISSDFRAPHNDAVHGDLNPAGPLTYVIMDGEPGKNNGPGRDYNQGALFYLAASTEQDRLNGLGYLAYNPQLVASVQDFATQLTSNGPITGGVVYFGHGFAEKLPDGSYGGSELAPGENSGQDTNISSINVKLLSNAQLATGVKIYLHACLAGYGNPGYPSIAQLIANQLQRIVVAPYAGTFFSIIPNPAPTLFGGNAPHITNPVKPIYLVPDFAKAPGTFNPSFNH